MKDAQQDQTGQQPRDAYLNALVKFAEGNLELGMTLFIRGTVITGTMISGRKYFEELSRQMRSASIQGSSDPADLQDVLGRAMMDFADMYPRAGEEPEPGRPPPKFLHLRNARIFQAANHLPSNGQLMRLRLDAVDGYFMGNIE
ncbi:hypothetical protein OHD62_23785 [Mesorhizobium sp. YC-39]|uniref:hypothetical protein n=1 Tax=unclassified Mesorhizobium TaxID=325217 RepID=UPI0021E9497B|nr:MULTISPECIES: hypothetical protein [unclassified Mesorhizobium]MCV3209244.1 hypothetical protein [Mesorhizobium sp. YC-2]MCV3231406.1 hypothetical protein [Mesorhizobium sp. YC-39]